MTNQIEQIMQWQRSRNLDLMPYNHQNEIKNIIEECVESEGILNSDVARSIAEKYIAEYISPCVLDSTKTVDAYCDMIVYAVGAIMKLGHEPSLALNECIREISDRTGSYDETVGKWVKQPKKLGAYKADYSKAKI